MAKPASVHVYRDWTGEAFARKEKYAVDGEKRFVWKQRVGQDTWVKDLNDGVDPGLYNAHLLEQAIAAHLPVHLTEGEKDADALLAEHPDWIVTSLPHGASVWRDNWRDVLVKTGKVTLYPDDDPDGHKFAARVAESLRSEGQKVTVLLAAEGCNDVAEHLEAGHGDAWRKVSRKQLAAWRPETKPSRPVSSKAGGKGRDPSSLLAMALERLKEHGRDDTGIWLACQLRDNGIPEVDARDQMVRGYVPAANFAAPKDDPYKASEAEENVRQAYSRQPREPLPSATSGRRQTDVGNSQRFVAQHHGVLRYCADWRSWLCWDGTRWVRDAKDVALGLAKQTASTIYEEAAQAGSKKEKAALRSWANRSEASHRVKAMLSLSVDEMAAVPEDFDQDGWLINCLNGVVDLRTGELREHRKEDLMTRLAPVVFDPDADAPRWSQFMREVMPGEAERSFLQRAVGYSLTGDSREQVMFITHGFGSNGKSTFLEMLRKVLGDYSQTAPPEALLQTRATGGASPDVARMEGRRFITASETGKNGELDETRVKQLTGSDTVAARGLFRGFREFTPTGKIWLATNHRPYIKGTDDGIWRRVPMIHFAQQFTGTAKDPVLMDTLAGELPGILAWAVRGCLEWQESGLQIPPSVVAETNKYREDQDTFGLFIKEMCKEGDGKEFVVVKTEFYQRYKVWCDNSGHRAASSQGVNRIMRERGYGEKKTTVRSSQYGRKTPTVWTGVRLRGSSIV